MAIAIIMRVLLLFAYLYALFRVADWLLGTLGYAPFKYFKDKLAALNLKWNQYWSDKE